MPATPHQCPRCKRVALIDPAMYAYAVGCADCVPHAVDGVLFKFEPIPPEQYCAKCLRFNADCVCKANGKPPEPRQLSVAGAAKEAGISPKLAQLQAQLMADGIATLAARDGKLYREITFEELIALPLTWLVRRSNGRAYAACQAGRKGVGLPSDSWEGDNKITGMLFFPYGALLTDFVFIDGTPFGVEVLLDESESHA